MRSSQQYALESGWFRAPCMIPTIDTIASVQHLQVIDPTHFLNKPSSKTGNIFKFSQITNCALVRERAAVILDLYVLRRSAILLITASRASSSLCISDRSIALLASSVAIGTWSAEAYNSDRFVVGRAMVLIRIRRSPVRCGGLQSGRARKAERGCL